MSDYLDIFSCGPLYVRKDAVIPREMLERVERLMAEVAGTEPLEEAGRIEIVVVELDEGEEPPEPLLPSFFDATPFRDT